MKKVMIFVAMCIILSNSLADHQPNQENTMHNRPKVGVGVMIVKNNMVLLGKRINSHGHNTWAFPGGHLEYGESFEQCALREVAEETGLEIKNVRFAAVTNDIFHQEEKHYITIIMRAEYSGGEPLVLEPNKCLEWCWFEWNNLPDPLFVSLQNLKQQEFMPF